MQGQTQGAAPSGLTALVVDDTLTSRHYLKQILQSLGVTVVHEAADGASAEALFVQQQPQLVFFGYSAARHQR